MDGLQFEHRCAELLRYRGFHKVIVTKGSGDQGIDIIAHKNGTKYGIQCKFYSYPVGNKAIQEAYAGADFYDCDAALVMTNSTFTRAAVELADKLDVQLWEHCSPNGSSHLISQLMHIFNIFMLTVALGSVPASHFLDYPPESIKTYISLILLICASLSGLIGWNHFLPCIISGIMYFGSFLWIFLFKLMTASSDRLLFALLLPSLISIMHALYARFRNRQPDLLKKNSPES